MNRKAASLVVLVSLVVGVFAFEAGADNSAQGGSTLARRVSALEDSADRQRRAIDDLRATNTRQQKMIKKLLRARTEVNERIARLNHRTVKLNGRGVYGGPVDNGQIQLGGDPSSCAGKIAEWNSAGTSLGCVPPAP